jgi:hypothetical protein
MCANKSAGIGRLQFNGFHVTDLCICHVSNHRIQKLGVVSNRGHMYRIFAYGPAKESKVLRLSGPHGWVGWVGRMRGGEGERGRGREGERGRGREGRREGGMERGRDLRKRASASSERPSWVSSIARLFNTLKS